MADSNNRAHCSSHSHSLSCLCMHCKEVSYYYLDERMDLYSFRVSTKPLPNGYGGGGRKASNGMNRNNDLWIQHGVGGASSHLLTETPSINDIKVTMKDNQLYSYYYSLSLAGEKK